MIAYIISFSSRFVRSPGYKEVLNEYNSKSYRKYSVTFVFFANIAMGDEFVRKLVHEIAKN